ncbi:MAG: cell wall anchor protein, partial [Verrucomicrobiota bacterium]
MKKPSHTSRLHTAALLAALAATPVLCQAQTTFDWTGATDGTWATGSNWNPSVDAPPGTNATDIARFNDDVANSAVNLDVSATINQLEFASGAGEY